MLVTMTMFLMVCFCFTKEEVNDDKSEESIITEISKTFVDSYAKKSTENMKQIVLERFSFPNDEIEMKLKLDEPNA
ncbi:hypothetical protein QUF55_02730 [Clostridiaceae bacterium HSG29]|nr:hypothetical protein [Clostridiaceae bacterium HSG29]